MNVGVQHTFCLSLKIDCFKMLKWTLLKTDFKNVLTT